MAENVYSTAADSLIWHSHIGTDSADVVGDATDSGTIYQGTPTDSTYGVRNRTFAVRGGGSDSSFRCNRSFYTFDLSGYSGTATDADFKFYSDNLGTAADEESTIFVVQATALAGSTADFGNVFSSGTTLGTLLANGQISTTRQYHSIPGSSMAGSPTPLVTAINNAVGSGTLTVGVMGYYDYRFAAGISTDWPSIGGNQVRIHMYYSEGTGTSKDPYLEIDGISVASSGYGNNVLGVASGDIAKVNGVATADIEKVIGVD